MTDTNNQDALLPCPKCKGTGYMGVVECDCSFGFIPRTLPTSGEAEPVAKRCTMGVGCDEYGTCYADAHGQPEQCPLYAAQPDASPASVRELVERVDEALTPSAATKAAYIGEFSFLIEEQSEDAKCPVTRRVDVPWSTIKEIMAAIRLRSSLDALRKEGEKS